TISGGTVTTTGSNVLASTNFGGTLAGGVTLNGTLDLTSFNANVAVTGGLTLGATSVVQIGNSTGTTNGELRFDGSESRGRSGTIQAQNGGTILTAGTNTNYAAGTLTGGVWKALANSTLRLISAGITSNAATIVLDGPNSNFFRDAGTTDALANFGANAAAGSFTIQNGRNYNPSVPFSNAGNLTIGASSTFTISNGGSQ